MTDPNGVTTISNGASWLLKKAIGIIWDLTEFTSVIIQIIMRAYKRSDDFTIQLLKLNKSTVLVETRTITDSMAFKSSRLLRQRLIATNFPS